MSATSDNENWQSEFLGASGLTFDRSVPLTLRPWMQNHKFVLVKSIPQLKGVIDQAIEAGEVALDLETMGFDNRVYFNEKGQPFSYKRIVGYCLCFDGVTGYYVPVHHEPKDSGNLDYHGAGAEISRLCRAAQPIKNASSHAWGKVDAPGRVKVLFWNAKFDQEWLYPVTGIRFWHPSSFEDGLLLAFAGDSDAENGLKSRAMELTTVAPLLEANQLQTQWIDDVTCIVRPKASVATSPSKGPVPYEMIEITELFKSGKRRDVDFRKLHPEEGLIYGCSDAIATFKLTKKGSHLWKIWEKRKSPIHTMSTYDLEKTTVLALREMERNRFKIDLSMVAKLTKDALKERDEILESINKVAKEMGRENFDVRSSDQVGKFLFDEDGLNLSPKPEKNEKSGQWQTSEEALNAVSDENPHPILKEILKFRQIDKVIGTYLSNLNVAVGTCPDGTLRSNFNQTGAATGRFTAPSGSPDDGAGVPTHGIPSSSDDRKPKVATSLRYCFVCEDDEAVVKIDYAGQELRAATNVSGEPVWIHEFDKGSGDLHTITAQAFFNKQEVTPTERKQGKICNFGLIYGGGPAVIQRATECSREEAVRRKKAFDAKVPTFARWVKSQHAKVKKDLGIRNAFGRWCSIPDAAVQEGDPVPGSKKGDVFTAERAQAVRAASERKSSNYPIQSCGADLMKLSMITLLRRFYQNGWLDTVKMRLTVHDEIVFTVKKRLLMEAIPAIQKIMEGVSAFAKNEDSSPWLIPMKVEVLVDKTWAAKHEWELMVRGKPYSPGDKVSNGMYVVDTPEGKRAYARIPEFLEGYVKPNHGQPIPEDQGATAQVAPAPPEESPSDQPPIPVVEFEVSSLTRSTAQKIAGLTVLAADPNGKRLRLTFQGTGKVLVSEEDRILVDPLAFRSLMLREGV